MNYYRHTLTYNGTAKVLDDPPADWDGFEESYYRHEDYHSILRSDGSALRFVNIDGIHFDRGGYWFIVDALETDGVKTEIYYTREKLNSDTNRYESDFEGYLELTPEAGYLHEPGDYIQVKCIDNAKLSRFINNSEIEYPLDSIIATNGNSIEPFVNHPKTIKLLGIKFILKADTSGWMTQDLLNVDTSAGFNIEYITEYDRVYSRNLLGTRYIESGLTIYENTSLNNTNIRINYDIDYFIQWDLHALSTGYSIRLYTKIIMARYDDTDTLIGIRYILNTYDDHNSFPNYDARDKVYTYSGNKTSSWDIPNDMLPGYTLKVFTEVSTLVYSGSYNLNIYINSKVNSLNIIENTTSSDIEVNGWLSYEATTRLLQLTTGNTGTNILEANILGRPDSEFTTYPSYGRLSLLSVMGGKAIRQYPDGKTKISFKKWFQSLDRMGNIGIWYDKEQDLFILEDKETFYKDTQSFELENVTNLKISHNVKSYFNEIDSGTIEVGEYEDFQGPFEYNIETNHSCDIPIKSKIDLRIPYNTDSVGVELSTRLLFKDHNIDSKQDNKTYIVEVNSSLTSVINSTIGTFTGFDSIENYYNGNYTPRKCLINNGNWISPLLYKEDSGNFTFVSNTKDLNIAYGGVNEQDNITASDLGTPLFYPEIYDCEFSVTNELIKQIKSDPHGYWKIPFKGVDYYGYIIQITINDYKRIGSGKFIKANKDR